MATENPATKETSQALFSDIPNETLIRILRFCGYVTILRFSAACKRYFNLVLSSTSLQLHIELEANGLDVVKGSCRRGSSYLDILTELQDYRDRWLSFNTDSPICIPISRDGSVELCEFHDGAFIGAYCFPNDELSPQANVLQVFPFGFTTQQPIHFPFGFHGFTSDLTQSLFALVKVDSANHTRAEIHLRLSTTGQSHPLAAYPLLTVDAGFPISHTPRHNMAIKVMEDMILIKLDNRSLRSYEVLLWNWHSGALLGRVGSRTGICDTTFLDDHHFVVCSAKRDEEAKWSLALQVYDILSHANTRAPPSLNLNTEARSINDPAVTLELPRPLNTFEFMPSGLLLRSKPARNRTIYTESAAFSGLHLVILKLSLKLQENGTSGEASDVKLSVFISVAQLLSRLEARRQNLEVASIPWSEWGPRATRWFLEGFDAEDELWPTSISGSRHIHQFYMDFPRLRGAISVIEFHTPIVSRDAGHRTNSNIAASSACAPGQDTVLDGWLGSAIPALEEGVYLPNSDQRGLNDLLGDDIFVDIIGSDFITIISKGFEQPVQSCLPFRVVTKAQMSPLFDRWFLDSNHVIAYEVGSELALYVYPVQPLSTS